MAKQQPQSDSCSFRPVNVYERLLLPVVKSPCGLNWLSCPLVTPFRMSFAQTTYIRTPYLLVNSDTLEFKPYETKNGENLLKFTIPQKKIENGVV